MVTIATALQLAVATTHADSPDSAEALFARGSDSVAQGQWQDAAAHFESSLLLEERAATHANLTLVYHELHRPLDVLRHGESLAAQTSAESGDARERVLARVREAVRLAKQEVADLSTDALPVAGALEVDDTVVQAQRGHVYVAPGRHRLELVNGVVREVVELTLVAGHSQPWPRAIAHDASAAAPPITAMLASPNSSLPSAPPTALAASRDDRAPHHRSIAAWALGATSVASQLAAVGTFAWSVRAAHRLDARDPSDPGYLDAHARYERIRVATVPLGLGAGLLAAAALVLAPDLHRDLQRRLRWWSLGAAGLALGAGVALALATPHRIGGEGSEARGPARFASTFAFALAIPLSTFSLQTWFGARSSDAH